MRSCLRVQVWVRMRWTGCEACDFRERRKGRQIFFNVMQHVRQSRVDQRL
jgi:hypothetical protein